MKKILISTFVILFVAACATGTTARDRIEPGASISGSVVVDGKVVPEAIIKITRFYEGECLFCMGSMILIYEGKTDKKGIYEYRTNLGGHYEVWVYHPSTGGVIGHEIIKELRVPVELSFILR